MNRKYNTLRNIKRPSLLTPDCITLVDTPTEIEGPHCNLKNLSQAEVLHRLALDANNLASQGLIQQATVPATGSFSISDFLVPGLQTKSWEDWQVTDELNPFATTADAQTYSANLTPFQFGLNGMMMDDATWDPTATTVAGGIPADMAYDEFVFDLPPTDYSNATVNVADLIVGPDSMASSTVVSPRDLQMPLSHDPYEDLALADFYGFTEHDHTADIYDSDSGSDLSDVDSLSDDDDDDDDNDIEEENDNNAANKADEKETFDNAKDNDQLTVPESALGSEDSTNILAFSTAAPELPIRQAPAVKEDPHKRRMEEVLVGRINNDLGPEHMPGLFKILKGGELEDGDEDEEVEVDLSRLDETTLVELYQYVETCCMQTLGSILAAEKEEQERQRNEALAAARKAQQEQEALERARLLERHSTPELSPSHSTSSLSVSPSPPYHSSYSTTERSSNNNKKRSATNSTSCTYKYERNDVEKQAESIWMTSQHKSKRKRMNNNSPVCMGGGGTGKGQRIKKFAMMDQEEQQLQLQQQYQHEDSEEIGEDDEIDIVGL
ncbi:hypothetical protein FBU30_002452 [Linnemannia zychae]|nr:hypothetical protein FBU30_002452 [Linnemannia zychae]